MSSKMDSTGTSQQDLAALRNDVISLLAGSPGAQTLKSCSAMLLHATQDILHENTDIQSMFMYGENAGDKEFRKQLADFLCHEYRDQISSSDLMVTAGATHGLHVLLSILLPCSCTVFMEDPTYFYAVRMIRDDLALKTVPVPSDAEGIRLDILDQLLSTHCPPVKSSKPGPPFWACLYLVPVFGNPTSISYSAEHCQELIRLARKYDILIIAEDVYNLIYFGDESPRRLLSYDHPSDPDYGGGHVLSNASFSKILSPSLRLGWIEGPSSLISVVTSSSLLWSGGSPNHYMSKLVTVLLQKGIQQEHLKWLRTVYKARMDVMCRVLDENLPEGCHFQRPQGGFFLWLVLHEDTDATEFMEFCSRNFGVTFLAGVCSSLTDSFKNCARLSISAYDASTIETATNNLCQAYKEFLQLKQKLIKN